MRPKEVLIGDRLLALFGVSKRQVLQHSFRLSDPSAQSAAGKT